MTDHTSFLKALQQEIDMEEKELNQARERLDERKNALAVLIQMLGERRKKESLLLSNVAPVLQEVLLPSEEKEPLKASTFLDEIQEVVMTFGNNEFTVADVDEYLKANHKPVNGKSPRARIAMALGDLEEKGEVIRTFRGKGSIPHRFKRTEKYLK
ncbi:hypothetical protein ROT06_000466 [Pseudomonas aeruginosa]|uniref:hypothetical protein n=1 Tax=Pseudomonas aeruginosa TaxID=287 RepID=UPI00208F5D95|nr:hypothetical protein [Pseudomonas aeruginosa]HEJ2540289.1 hypothetical protein [Pseudomonas aeruginosa]